MPRRQIPFVPGTYYHLYNRGNNRQRIFFEAENCLYFLQGIKKYLQPVISLIAYCLMPTHYHLLVRIRDQTQTPEAPIMRRTSEVFLGCRRKDAILRQTS